MKKQLLWVLTALILASCQGESAVSPTIAEQPVDPGLEVSADIDTDLIPEYSEWNLETLQLIDKESIHQIIEFDVLKGHQGMLIYLDFHPKGHMLASSGDDGSIRLWDLNTGAEIASLKHGPQGMGVSFHPADSFLATGGSDNISRVWDIDTATQIHEFEGHVWGVLDVQYSPDGSRIATSSRDDSVRVWDPESEEEVYILHGHSDDIYKIGFSPDGTTLASGGLEGKINIWNMDSGELITELLGNEEGVFYLTFSPGGDLLASCGGGLIGRDNSIRLFDTSSWELLKTFEKQSSTVVGCEFSNDGSLLVARLQQGGLLIWDHEAEERLYEIDVPPSWPPAMAISPDDRLIAVGDQTGDIHLFGIPE
jgi:WD40 repeat protein